jgi:hypothetical protein
MFPALFVCIGTCRGEHTAKVVCEPHSRQGDDQPCPIAINRKKGGGVLAREKISDSLLDGSRTESY